MGNSVTAALIGFVIMAAQAGAAEPRKREWTAIPGHTNILVDVASVAPMWTSLQGPRDYSTTPPTDVFRIPTETTNVTIKLNGHIFDHYILTCSGFLSGNTQPSRVEKEVGKTVQVLGDVPGGVVEALACPIARAKAKSTQP